MSGSDRRSVVHLHRHARNPSSPSVATGPAAVRRNPRGCETGVSLVEVLISLALLSLVVIGILPLFSTAVGNNREGNQLARVTNHARHHLERLMVLPFDDPALAVPNGEPSLETRELYSRSEDRWYLEDEFPEGERPEFSRVTLVRQFGVSALQDGDLEFEDDEILAGGTPAGLVHLKEIEVRVTSGLFTNVNTLGARKAITVRILRSS